MKPQCESGGFDMRKGYCPGMNDARWKLHNRDKRNANFLSQQKSKENVCILHKCKLCTTNTVVLNQFHSVKSLLFSSARPHDFDGMLVRH